MTADRIRTRAQRCRRALRVPRANGVEIVAPPEDRPYGLRDYAVRDLDGFRLAFGHPLLNAGPPLKIERVDVPLRLEKRLAALLHDLAEHKRMSLNSRLEEILLRTCEPLGDGVASPHTKKTLSSYIQELKRKHGIDYDSHGSYALSRSSRASARRQDCRRRVGTVSLRVHVNKTTGIFAGGQR